MAHGQPPLEGEVGEGSPCNGVAKSNDVPLGQVDRGVGVSCLSEPENSCSLLMGK